MAIPVPMAPADDDVLIRAGGVSRWFGGVKANTDIDLGVRRGEIVGIMGPNGAEKSTFRSLLARAQRPSARPLVVCGHEMSRASRGAAARLGMGLANKRCPGRFTRSPCDRTWRSLRRSFRGPAARRSALGCTARRMPPPARLACSSSSDSNWPALALDSEVLLHRPAPRHTNTHRDG